MVIDTWGPEETRAFGKKMGQEARPGQVICLNGDLGVGKTIFTPEYAEGRDRAVFCREKVVPAMEALREPVDELEMIVDKEMWPMPSYGDLVFEV